ncbi:hypothetical protein G0Q06_05830 [Puniceicoccales bacterium CK1056]|uniref:DUF2339 domain-containing protein n=1 Tax=Oceanipulchritudo coccoides TaxID=2706888 RepID=A0A6B2M1F4_9BACT|nr:hypothetical protein [Oceanipulchritudo coccoides]NDV61964.1 hypothetical protein [Oceanipulchritudo coccoides]
MEITLLLLVVGFILVSPFILIGVAVSHRKRLNRLEEEIHHYSGLVEELMRRPAQPTQSVEPVRPEMEKAPEAEPEPAPTAVPVIPAAVAKKSLGVESLEEPAYDEVIPKEPSLPEEPDFPGEIGDPMPTTGEKLRDFLRGIGMWPPESVAGHDREAILMKWWLPRIGGLLALLSALFFGVYVNQSTTPFIRCMELAATAVGITGLGWYLEKKLRTFGGVLVVTGLVMLYLASVAAYVLPAMRFIENPLVGALLQAVVLLVISVVGFLRRSEGIVLLAFHLGYLLGIFMAWEGLREGALIAAGLLFVAGALLSRMQLFRHLTWIIIPGSMLVVIAFPLLALLRTVEVPAGISVQVYLNLVMAGSIILYLLNGLGTGWRPKLLFSIGSSLALLGTGWFFREFDPDMLEWASLVLGCTLLAGSIAGWALRGCGFLAQLLFTKASFLIAVWAILHFAGDLRWMVLGIQTIVVALSARRAKAIALECVTWAVALVSVGYFVPVFLTNPEAGTLLWWLMVLYPGVIVLGLSIVLPAFQMPRFDYKEADRRLLYGALPFLAVWLWFRLFAATQAGNVGAPAPFLAVMYGMAAVSFIPWIARWISLMTSGILFVLASILFCSEPFSPVLLVLLLIPAVASLIWLTGKEKTWAILAENAVYVLSFVPVILWILQLLGDWSWTVALMPVLAIALSALGTLPRLRHAGAWAFLPFAVFYVSEGVRGSTQTAMLLTMAVGIGWLALPPLISRVSDGLGWAKRYSLWAVIGTVLLAILAIDFSNNHEHWLVWQCTLLGLSALLIVGTQIWKVPGYFLGAIVFGGTAMLRHAESMLSEPAAYIPWISEALISSGVIFALLLLWFFLKTNPWRLKEAKSQDQLDSLLSASVAVLFFLNSALTFHYHGLGWMSWYTPLLALTAFSMILLGLFRADPVFRKLGLLALALPLLRLFLVDVQDALYRIVAFAAAAIVLTVLGYLYSRLAAKLGDSEEEEEEEEEEVS